MSWDKESAKELIQGSVLGPPTQEHSNVAKSPMSEPNKRNIPSLACLSKALESWSHHGQIGSVGKPPVSGCLTPSQGLAIFSTYSFRFFGSQFWATSCMYIAFLKLVYLYFCECCCVITAGSFHLFLPFSPCRPSPQCQRNPPWISVKKDFQCSPKWTSLHLPLIKKPAQKLTSICERRV